MKQGTQEWLDFRRSRIGSSDSAAIMGISPFKTRYQVWEEKVLGKEQPKTPAMMRGSYYEEEARECFEKMTGISVMPKVIVHKEKQWLMASLDGISFDGSVITEIKVPTNLESHERAKKGDISDFYNVQIQHDYATNEDIKTALYFSYNPLNKEGVIVDVKKDDCLIEKILKEDEEFYDLMINRVAPSLSERDYRVREDESWKLLAQGWLDVDKRIKLHEESIKQLEESKNEFKGKLINLAGDQNSKGFGIRVTRSDVKGRIDYDQIPQLKGVNLDAYRSPTSQRWTIASCK